MALYATQQNLTIVIHQETFWVRPSLVIRFISILEINYEETFLKPQIFF